MDQRWLQSWLDGGARHGAPRLGPPVSVQPDVPHKLVQMPVRALALHPPGETHQAVDVLDVGRHLETLLVEFTAVL